MCIIVCIPTETMGTRKSSTAEDTTAQNWDDFKDR